MVLPADGLKTRPGAGPFSSGPAQDRLLAVLPLRVRSQRAVTLFCIAWGCLVFALDHWSPLGVADDALYVTVVLATLWLRRPRAATTAALLTSGAVLLGLVGAPFDVTSLVNHLITLVLIWSATVLVLAINGALDRLDSVVDEREALVREANHRLKNNLAMVTSLLELQAEAVQHADARAALEQAHGQVQAMALLHAQLSRSQTIGEDVDLPAYLSAVVAAFRNGHPHVRILEEFTREGLRCDAGRAIPCGLIVTELLTNAAKHAFPAGAPGEIGVGLSRAGENYELRVWDRGVGLPPDLDLERVACLGLKLVRLLAPRLRGSYSVSRAAGTAFRFTFPATPVP